MDKYKIDDVAKESGLTKRTIRYYEEIGILTPPERSEGGTRLYTRDHIEQLKTIVNARDVLGFNLQEIQEYITSTQGIEEVRQGYYQTEDRDLKIQKLNEVGRLLAGQLEVIDQKMAKMSEIREATLQRIKRVQDGLAKITKE